MPHYPVILFTFTFLTLIFYHFYSIDMIFSRFYIPNKQVLASRDELRKESSVRYFQDYANYQIKHYASAVLHKKKETPTEKPLLCVGVVSMIRPNHTQYLTQTVASLFNGAKNRDNVRFFLFNNELEKYHSEAHSLRNFIPVVDMKDIYPAMEDVVKGICLL